MQTALSDLLVFGMCGLSGNQLLMLSLASLRLWSHRSSCRSGVSVLTWISDVASRSAEASGTFSCKVHRFFFSFFIGVEDAGWLRSRWHQLLSLRFT